MRATVESPVYDYKNTYCPECNRIIISNEHLSHLRPVQGSRVKRPIGANRKHKRDKDCTPRAIIPFLQRFNEEIWKTGRVKVILVLRNQAEWLASAYAEDSDLIKCASQKDFEEQIDNLIENEDDYIDWSCWVKGLQQALGPENICILLLEDIARETFWNHIIDFAEVGEVTLSQIITDNNALTKNVRRYKNNKWKLKPFGGEYRHLLPLRIVRELWPEQYLPRARNTVLSIVHQLCRHINLIDIPPVNTFLDRNRDLEIEMHKPLQERIIEYCRTFNYRLAQLLFRNDLKDLGY